MFGLLAQSRPTTGPADFFNGEIFLDNSPAQWLGLLGLLLGGLVVGKVLTFVLLRQSERLLENQKAPLLGLVFRSLARPMTMLALAAALYAASFVLDLSYETAPDTTLHDHWVRICTTIAVLAAAWFIYCLVDVVEHFLTRWTSRTDTTLDDQLVPLLRKSLRVFVVIVSLLFIAQNVFKWNIASLIAGLGIGGLALALAAKDMLANLFGSITIFADRPFVMNERVQIRGYDGTVEEVGFRSTRLRLLNGHQVTVPNSIVANEPVENIGRRPYLKRVLNVTITYDTPPEKVQRGVEILRELLEARKDHFAPDLEPQVYFSDFNAASLNLQVYYWFVPPDWWEYLAFNHEFNMELLRRFNEEGIEFAFPTQTLYLKQGSDFEADVRTHERGSGGSYT